MLYLVETYAAWTALNPDQHADGGGGEPRAARCLGAISLPSDETVLSLYETRSLEALIDVLGERGITPDRIVEARLITRSRRAMVRCRRSRSRRPDPGEIPNLTEPTGDL